MMSKEYADLFEVGKNWDFPKMHSQKHAFDDIRAKGVTKNYNTKTNEKLHGPIKDSYHLRTNFRDVAKQILNADQICFASLFIRSRIDAFDEYEATLSTEKQELDDINPENSRGTYFPKSYHHSIGSIQRPLNTISEIMDAHSADIAFKDFHKKLSKFMSGFLPIWGIDLPKDIKYPFKVDVNEKVMLLQNEEHNFS